MSDRHYMHVLKDTAPVFIDGRIGVQRGHGTYDNFKPIEPMQWFKNIAVNTAYTLIAEYLGGNFEFARPAFIEIGNHGDYLGAVDTGVRVPPQITDTGVRNTIFRKAILDFSYSDNIAVFKTFLGSFEGNASDIDEFALLSADERAYSHVVTPEQFPSGPATKLVKNEGLHALIVYEIEILPCSP